MTFLNLYNGQLLLEHKEDWMSLHLIIRIRQEVSEKHGCEKHFQDLTYTHKKKAPTWSSEHHFLFQNHTASNKMKKKPTQTLKCF